MQKFFSSLSRYQRVAIGFVLFFLIGANALLLVGNQSRTFRDYITAAVTLSNIQDILLNRAAMSKTEALRKYVPGELIVKLKSSATGGNLSKSLSQLNNANLPKSLRELNQRLGVMPIRPLLTSKILMLRQKSELSAVSSEPVGLDRLYIFTVPGDATDMEKLAQVYKSNEYVEYAEPNYFVTAIRAPNDSYYLSKESWSQTYDDLWGLKRINMEKAWDITEGLMLNNKSIVVAVIDTGVDYTHEDLTEDLNSNRVLDLGEDANANGHLDSNIWVNSGEDLNKNDFIDASDFDGLDNDRNGYIDDLRGWDFSTCVNRARGSCSKSKQPDNDPMDGDGHGTHIAGTIAALGDNRRGIIGIAPKAKIMPVKAMDDGGSGTVSEFVAAIRYATDNGAQVISNSWTVHNSSQAIKDAIADASSVFSSGGSSRKVASVVVVAAGNKYGQDAGKESPADAPEAIVVAAGNPDGTRTDFSNSGKGIDVVAPGLNILSLRGKDTDTYGDGKHFVGEKYYRSDGTSMAAPHVAGVAALISAYHPGLTPSEIRRIIRESADESIELWATVRPGVGWLNAYAALMLDPTNILDVDIASPGYGTKIPEKTAIQIRGTATGAAFASYQLFYAPASQSLQWQTIGLPVATRVTDGLLGTFEPGTLNGDIFLRLVATNTNGRVFQYVTPLNIAFVESPPKQITSQQSTQQSPFIDGNHIVWVDARNEGWDIYHYDLNNPERGEQRLTARSQLNIFNQPTISKGRVVWNGVKDNQNFLYVYDFAQPNLGAQELTKVGGGAYPIISDNLIAWMNDKIIALYDLNHPELGIQQPFGTLTAPIGFFPDHFAIEGRYLAWLANDLGLYVANLDQPAISPKLITTVSSVPVGNLALNGGKIAWSSMEDIYLYDLNHPELGEQRLITNLSKQENPALSGNFLVWVDDRNAYVVKDLIDRSSRSNLDLYFYDLSHPELGERQLTSDIADQTTPAIFGNHVVSVDTRNGNKDIYMYELPFTMTVSFPRITTASSPVFQGRNLGVTGSGFSVTGNTVRLTNFSDNSKVYYARNLPSSNNGANISFTIGTSTPPGRYYVAVQALNSDWSGSGSMAKSVVVEIKVTIGAPSSAMLGSDEEGTAPGNANALCLYNRASGLSKSICDYYAEKRPGAQKLGVSIPDSSFTDGGNREQMNGPEFLRLVVKPLYGYINSHPELNITHLAVAKDIPIRIVDTEKYLAKGNDFMPEASPKTVFASSNFLLSIQGDYANATNLSEYVFGSSVTDDNGCVALKPGFQSSRNLEYQKTVAQHFNPDDYKNRPYANNPRFVVSFLSGYSFSDIKNMIDKAQLPAPTKDKVAWVFDLDTVGSGSFYSEEQHQKFKQDIMESAGAPLSTIFGFSAQRNGRWKQYTLPIIGYWGMGIYNPGYGKLWIAENPVIKSSVTPRALLTSLESWNGYTFQGNAKHTEQPTFAGNQGNIADAFAPNAFGGADYANSFSGAVGNVYEPTNAGTVHQEALFANYAAGLTLGESVLKSFRYLPNSLYSVHIAVGDPLMRAFDEPVSAGRAINFGNSTVDNSSDISTTGGRRCYTQPSSCTAPDGTVVADGVGICADAARKQVCVNGAFSAQTTVCKQGCSLGSCVEEVFTPPNKLSLKKYQIYPLVVLVKTTSNKLSDIFRNPPDFTDIRYRIGSVERNTNYSPGLGWTWGKETNSSVPDPDILPGTGILVTPNEDYEVTLGGQPFNSSVAMNLRGTSPIFGIPFCGDKYTASQALREVQKIEPRCTTIANMAKWVHTYPSLYWGIAVSGAIEADFKLNNYESYYFVCDSAVNFVWKPSCNVSGTSGAGASSNLQDQAAELLNRLKEMEEKINKLR